MRIALGIEYEGTHYHGWQAQTPDLSTVQKWLEQSLSAVADHPVEVICAGRTDAGVHALSQVIHFETSAKRPNLAWVRGTNTHLPRDIRVIWAQEVTADFHARFSATARQYRYHIYNHVVPSAIYHNHITWCNQELDIDLMNQAAALLVGEHDFTSFRSAACQAKSPKRTILHFAVTRQGKIVIVDVKANAFLHHMVRNMVGVLMAVGQRKNPPIWAQEVLLAKDRQLGGVTAPAAGLYFIAVDYPEHFQLPQCNELPILLG